MTESGIHKFRKNLAFRLLTSVAIVLFVSILTWSYFRINYKKKTRIETKISEVDKFCNTVLNFTWFAMLHNPNEDMREVLQSMSDYNEIETIQICDTHGQIKFSNRPGEIGRKFDKKDVPCFTCHQEEKPKFTKSVEEKVRIFKSDSGESLLGIINPILNKPGCSTAQCHYHPDNITKLGTLNVIVSLTNVEKEIANDKTAFALTGVYLFFILSFTIGFFLIRFVTSPIRKLTQGTHRIAQGSYLEDIQIYQNDEIGELAESINEMGREISGKQVELNRQKDLYRNLFEHVPCIITVQDPEYRLIEYNQEFADRFDPKEGAFCFAAYKGLDSKCLNCPVEKTFKDGISHYSEESGFNKDGSEAHWLVKTAPLRDENGKITAAMEMCIDITRRKILEKKVKKSEQKYQAIFKNIPNPVFVLETENLSIIDCNDSVTSVYGYSKEEVMDQPFSMFFSEDISGFFNNDALASDGFHERIENFTKTGSKRFVNLWITPSEFPDRKVFLVTVIDITVSVETEQQLMQAGKMATLGEMASGVAHELNQPLSVLKTASSFITKKIRKDEPIKESILKSLAAEIEEHVDRASNIISHMRLFSRKSILTKENLNVNDVLKRAFDIFSQQLKLREINVIWNLAEALPEIIADAMRLEQVFINLLINARDAIVEKCGQIPEGQSCLRHITLETRADLNMVYVIISDTGTGIAEENINKIFEPFFTTKKVGHGTGLGLSISYGIVRECGGEIKVKNNPSGGATFTISFPRV